MALARWPTRWGHLKELRGWFAGHREPHERALLIAATALSPSADQTLVYSTASDLARRLQIVLAAARALAADGNHAEVLASALNWSAQTNRERLSGPARRCRRYAGAALFLNLAEPVAESGLPQILDGPQAVEPTRCEPAWRAALDAVVVSRITETAFEGVARRWLDAALHHQRVRARLIRCYVDAASPSTLPMTVAYSNPQAAHVSTPAMIMIEVVRRWAAVDRKNPARRQIKEAIVIPLTRPWWLRLLKILYIHLRTLIAMTERKI